MVLYDYLVSSHDPSVVHHIISHNTQIFPVKSVSYHGQHILMVKCTVFSSVQMRPQYTPWVMLVLLEEVGHISSINVC